MNEKLNLSNFTVNENNQIVKDGIVLPVREGIRAAVKSAEIKKKQSARSKKQMRFKDGSYLTQQQVIDENYQIRNKIS